MLKIINNKWNSGQSKTYKNTVYKIFRVIVEVWAQWYQWHLSKY